MDYLGNEKCKLIFASSLSIKYSGRRYMNYSNTLEYAQQMDREDPLRKFRDHFFIPRHGEKDSIYFTGNSLGLQPKKTREHILQELDDWAALGVDGHFAAKHPWFSYHERFTKQIAALVGALPEEVVVMNQLTVNLHLLLTSFYRPVAGRFKIICEAKAFPSDQYALESQVRLHGLNPADTIVEVAPRKGDYLIQTSDLLEVIEREGSSTALVILGGVHYYSGQVFDMKAITKAAHAVGAYAGFDLAHAVGNIELRLHEWKVDFACWCSYKYLNSGPGGVAGAYIHQNHCTDTSIPRLAGWWGYDKETRFLMKPGFQPIPTAEGWQLSNAPVLSMAAHKAALDIFEEAGMPALVNKSRKLTGYLFYLLDEINKESGKKNIEVITPREAGAHGCQVSMLMGQEGKEIFNTLTREGVIADWREPNVIRVAPVPLYNSFEDVYRFCDLLRSCIKV
jgi:kynureninase